MQASLAIAEREEPHVAGLIALQEQALAVIKSDSLRDVLKFQAQADAAKRYFKKHGNYQEATAKLSELSMRAAKRGGEILSELGLRGGDRKSKFHDGTLKLSDIGISRQQSCRWQAIAAIPEQTFEHHIRQAVERSEPVTMKSLLKLAPKRSEVIEVPRAEPVPESSGRVVKSFEELAGEKFATIYADPPWSYGNQATRAATDRHYVTMSVADICAMPVKDFAADNAQLHLWTTSGFLREAFEVIDAWGFSYRSGFVWCKSTEECDADNVNMSKPARAKLGIGNYWRLSHEYLLTAIRGSATFTDKSLPSWAALRRGDHSGKPDAVRFMVEKAFKGPRLELFGRHEVRGWTVFGNEVQRGGRLALRD